VRRAIFVRISPYATSPAVCGLSRPVILIPQSLANKLQPHEVRAVLMHELAHVKRGDLWINLIQTLLQIAYFYNPLLWLANAVIRRVREQAVDETVLVAMGDAADEYPETLVHIARLALTSRPALTLRLIGVVESKSALTARIKHILTHPIPKSAKLGLLGLLGIIVVALILLPMGKTTTPTQPFSATGGPLDIRLIAVRPDAGEEYYNPVGERLDWNPGVLNTYGDAWDADDCRRDLLFELSDANESVLFDTLQHIRVAGWGLLKRPGVRVMGLRNGNVLCILSVSIPRHRGFDGKVIPYWFGSSEIRQVDLTLRYFYGPPRDPVCTFTGPLEEGGTIAADGNPSYQVTCERLFPIPNPSEMFRLKFTAGLIADDDISVLIYDTDGRRHHPVTRPSGRTTFVDVQGPLDRVSKIIIGEKPHERVFRNVVVSYHHQPTRTYAAYLDRMAKVLNLEALPKNDLASYQLRTPSDALAVLDVIHGGHLSRDAVEAICAMSREDLSHMDEPSREELNSVAHKWVASADLDMRLRGVRLGLLGDQPDFFSQAISLLQDDYHYLPETDGIMYDLGHIAGLLVNRWRDRLTEDQRSGLALFLNGSRVLPILASPDKGIGGDAFVRPAGTTKSQPIGRYALQFDGVDDCLIVPARASTTLRPPFAIEMWIEPDFSDPRLKELGTFMALVRQGRKVDHPAAVSRYQDTGFAAFLYSPWASNNGGTGGAFLTAREEGGIAQAGIFHTDFSPWAGRQDWMRVLIAWDKLPWVPSSGEPLMIGENIASYGVPFKGRLGEIRIWNTSQIPQSGYAPLTGSEPNLVGCWTFSEGSGQLVHDISPNHNDAYLGNSASVDATDPAWVALSKEEPNTSESSGSKLEPQGSASPTVTLRRWQVLDLASGDLTSVNPVEFPTEEFWQTVEAADQGDLLFDGSMLCLVRGATATGNVDRVLGLFRGHVISQRLPETLIVITHERGRYEVKIQDASKYDCALEYSLLTPGKDAGMGTLTEPNVPAISSDRFEPAAAICELLDRWMADARNGRLDAMRRAYAPDTPPVTRDLESIQKVLIGNPDWGLSPVTIASRDAAAMAVSRKHGEPATSLVWHLGGSRGGWVITEARLEDAEGVKRACSQFFQTYPGALWYTDRGAQDTLHANVPDAPNGFVMISMEGRYSWLIPDREHFSKVEGVNLPGGHAISFEGIDDCLIVPPSPSLTLKPPFTIEVWIKPDFSNPRFTGRSTLMSLVRQGRRVDNPPQRSHYQQGGFAAFLYSPVELEETTTQAVPSLSEDRQASRSPDFAPYAWPRIRLYGKTAGAFMAGYQDGGMYQRSVFGSEDAPVISGRPGWTHMYIENPAISWMSSPGEPLVIGGNVAPYGLPYKGQIAEIRVWSKNLNRTERVWYGSKSLTGNEPNLVACWMFSEGSGQIVHDISPNHNDTYLGNSTGVDDADPEWIDLPQEEAASATGRRGGGE
jgi:hypothetical protein